MKIWKITNLFVLSIQAIIISLGTFCGHISFGMGLGDLFGYGFMYLVFIVHLVLTIGGHKKSNRYFMWLTAIFLCITVFICLEATIWRKSEYRCNGYLLYKHWKISDE